MIEALDRGVSVLRWTAMTRLFGRVTDCNREGERQAAKEYFDLLLPAPSFTKQYLDIFIHFH
jgi:hypothetical protein